MRKLIGTIGVDSGQLMVGDPCYFLEGDYDEVDKPYRRACDATHDPDNPEKRASHFHPRKDEGGDAICTSTAFGDGEYSVYIEYESDGKTPIRMIVDLQ